VVIDDPPQAKESDMYVVKFNQGRVGIRYDDWTRAIDFARENRPATVHCLAAPSVKLASVDVDGNIDLTPDAV
jgi:hypothetical protein